MLRYLNGYVNSKTAPDENYARELMDSNENKSVGVWGIAGCSVMVTRTQTLPPQRGAPVRSSDIRGNAPVVMRPGGNVFGLCAGCHERGDDAGLRDAQEAPSE